VTLVLVGEGTLALGVGAVLAVGAAAAVLGPLWRAAEGEPADEPRDDAGPVRDTPGAGEGATAVDALREIEFDRATGKLSDADYAALKATYTRRALAELRAREGAAADAVGAVGTAVVADDDAVEAAIRRYRTNGGTVCPACGPRPEPDATFCSSCGRYLAGRCTHCGAACDQPGQRFCADCGHSLAG
jgi:hypothetical protein